MFLITCTYIKTVHKFFLKHLLFKHKVIYAEINYSKNISILNNSNRNEKERRKETILQCLNSLA